MIRERTAGSGGTVGRARTWRSAHVFGPIPSRRLGASLAVDVIPPKVCPLDCVYCEVGRTTVLTLERKEYVRADAILEELEEALGTVGNVDYITMSASGEPTLNSRLGEIIHRVKSRTQIPVAILTSGVLLSEKEVRADLLEADLVLPSLDAASEETFRRINRPHGRLNLPGIIAGLVQFRHEYHGPIWLEVLFVKGLNHSKAEVEGLRKAIEEIRPDRIQLNTVVRPPAESGAQGLRVAELEELATMIGRNCEVIR